MVIKEAPAQIEQGVATVSIVDLVKQAYEKGMFTKLNCVGRHNACDLELGPMDKERLIGYFRKRKEFNVEEHNESGVYSVEFISEDYDIEIFDSFMRVYKIPQNEARKISAQELQKLLTEDVTTNEPEWESWTDVYAIFQGFLDKYWPDTDKVEAAIDEFTGKYPDNRLVQQAVDRWCDPDCDFVPNPHTDLEEGFEEDEWSDDELASIYGGDTKYDMPDGIETPDETEARLRANLVGDDGDLVNRIQLEVAAEKRTPVKITNEEYYTMMNDCVDLPELTTDISQGTGNVIVYYCYNKKDDTVYCYADY